jgi:pyrimidine deaminase RibD-like protein
MIKKMSAGMKNPNCEASTKGFWRMMEKKIFIASRIVCNKRNSRPARKSLFFHFIARITAAHAR